MLCACKQLPEVMSTGCVEVLCTGARQREVEIERVEDTAGWAEYSSKEVVIPKSRGLLEPLKSTLSRASTTRSRCRVEIWKRSGIKVQIK